MHKKFVLLLWIFSLTIAPVFYGLYQLTIDPIIGIGKAFELVPVMIIMSIVFSLPTLLLTFLFVWQLGKFIQSKYLINILVLFLFLLGVVASFKVIGGYLAFEMTSAYCSGVLVSWFLLIICWPRIK